MKNKSLKLLALLLTGVMLTGCSLFSKKDNGSSSNKPDDNEGQQGAWSTEIQVEMNKYIGEVLPYVQLNEDTIYHGYDDTYGSLGVFYYVIGDENENNVLEGYGDSLLSAGYVYDSDEYGEYYDKDINGFTVSVSFEYYNAETDPNPGNEITVMVPQYVDEEYLLAAGYEKAQGWPTELVTKVMQGTNKTLTGVNTSGEWFVAEDIYEDTDEGYWYRCLYLATQGDYVNAFGQICSSLGYGYDEDYGCYCNTSSSASDEEIYVYEATGYTLIDIFGPSFTGSAPVEGGGDVGGDTTNPDGSITVTFDFSSKFNNGVSLTGASFSTETASISFAKGDGASDPAYYTANGPRLYFGNSFTITSLSSDFAISSVSCTEITRNEKADKVVTTEFLETSKGNLSVTATTASVTNVNNDNVTLSVTHLPDGITKTGGYLSFNVISVMLMPVY